MSRSIAVALIVAAAGLPGCGMLTGPHPWIDEGDAKSVVIGYSGDVGSTLPLARQHCAEYERVPRLTDPGFDKAVYDCVKP